MTISSISPIEEIIEDIKNGKMVILTDEEDRENEGDIVIAGQFVTAEHINFMVKYARGLVCLTLTEEKCQELQLPLMVNKNDSSFGTNFTVSIEAAEGVTTGISAGDRARTIQCAVNPKALPTDIVQPGHIFPLKAKNGGVLTRAGHTEAGCDLAKLAGLIPASVICEILNEDGTMARLPDLIPFAQQHGLKIGTIASLIEYRSRNEKLVEKVSERLINTRFGEFNLISFRDQIANEVHFVLQKGDINSNGETLVRVHEPINIIDFIETSEGHSWQIDDAMEVISQHGGILVMLNRGDEHHQELLRHASEGKIRTTAPKKQGLGLRDYGVGAQILKDLGVHKMKLLSKPRKIPSVTGFNLEVTGYIACKSDLSLENL